MLRMSTVSLFPREVLDELVRRFGSHFEAQDDVARLALATALVEGRVTNRRMQELSERHARDLTAMLQRLVAQHLLLSHGERAGTWYTLATGPGGASNSSQSSSQSSSQTDLSDPVGAVASSRWARRELVEAAIIAVCQDGWLTSREIAERVGRRQTTLTKNYLGPLVRAGRLRLRDPKQWS